MQLRERLGQLWTTLPAISLKARLMPRGMQTKYDLHMRRYGQRRIECFGDCLACVRHHPRQRRTAGVRDWQLAERCDPTRPIEGDIDVER
jgi:hypothetical protein